MFLEFSHKTIALSEVAEVMRGHLHIIAFVSTKGLPISFSRVTRSEELQGTVNFIVNFAQQDSLTLSLLGNLDWKKKSLCSVDALCCF